MLTKQFCTNDDCSMILFILGLLLLPGNTSSRNPASLLGLKTNKSDQQLPEQLVGILFFDSFEVLKNHKTKLRGD